MTGMHSSCARVLCLHAIPGPFHPPSLLSVLLTEGAFGSSLNLEPPPFWDRFSRHKILWHLVLYFGQVWFLCGSTWTRMRSLWCSQSLVWYSYQVVLVVLLLLPPTPPANPFCWALIIWNFSFEWLAIQNPFFFLACISFFPL